MNIRSSPQPASDCSTALVLYDEVTTSAQTEQILALDGARLLLYAATLHKKIAEQTDSRKIQAALTQNDARPEREMRKKESKQNTVHIYYQKVSSIVLD